MPGADFYSKLPSCSSFLDLTFTDEFFPLPEDWLIIITDIKGSTKAIEAGHYKTVNMIGATSIVALLNVAGTIELPFIFGGDGASIAIPPTLLEPAKQALLATQALSQQEFTMELRIGIVPVQKIYQAGFQCTLAKLQASPNYSQAIFSGGGLKYAEDLVKDPDTHNSYLITGTGNPEQADLAGLECRWHDILSSKGETLSILIKATGTTSEEEYETYRMALHRIQEIFGEPSEHHPITAQNLSLTISPLGFVNEAKAKTKSTGMKMLISLMSMWKENCIALFSGQIDKASQLSLEDYKSILIMTADYRKFDDTLRMVIASSPEQRKQLQAYLEPLQKSGKLVYGIHISNRAHMTCLVFERQGRQVHFVDGADGGYALAAKQLKSQLLS